MSFDDELRGPDSNTSDAGASARSGAAGRAAATSRLGASPHSIARAVAKILRKESDGASRDDNGVAAGAADTVDRASGSSGAALPDDVRARFEGSLGADLSAVRVHTGPDSAAAAHAVGAQAYTVGQDIHFAEGKYAPSDPFGVHLLAHEVAHTVQQSGSSGGAPQAKLEVSTPGDAAEVEADRAADAMVAEQPTTVTSGSGLSRQLVQREPPTGDPRLPTESAGPPSPTTDRALVLTEAQHRMTTAIGQFSTAAVLVKQSLKDAAKAQREMVALIADVAMGFLIPGLAAAAVGRIAARLAVSVPALQEGVAEAGALATHVAALQRLAKNDAIMSLIKTSDIAKATLTGVTKAGVGAIKATSGLFGDSEVDAFILKLNTAVDVAISTARGELAGKSMGEIVSAYMAFDPAETNADTYVPALNGIVSRFQAQVASQGTREQYIEHGMHSTVLTNHVAVIKGAASDGPRLALVEGFPYAFKGWVDNTFKQMALDKTAGLTGSRNLPWVEWNNVLMLNREGSGAGAAAAAKPPMTGTWTTNEGKLIVSSESHGQIAGQYETQNGRGTMSGTRNGDLVSGTWASIDEQNGRKGRFSIKLAFTLTTFDGTQTVDGDATEHPYSGTLKT